MNDYIQKAQLTEKQRLMIEQLVYSCKSIIKEAEKEYGFSISYLAEHNDAVCKYFKSLQKEFRLQ